MPKLCEKCGIYDPTPTISAESRCPACGVVYAKLPPASGLAASTAAASTSAASSAGNSPADSSSAGISSAGIDWLPVSRSELWIAISAVCALFAIILLDDDGFVLLLDHANLAFHEAGHIFFGLLGSTLGLYGGTLGQLVFPVVAMFSFLRRRQAIGFALSGVWLFENFLNIARYMADARAQLLPLVGGGEHDWYHILSRWGLLDSDTTLAAALQTLGWLGMIACVVGLWRLVQAREFRDPLA